METNKIDQIKNDLRGAGWIPFLWSSSDVLRDWNCSEAEALEILEYISELEYFQECVFDFISAVCLDRGITQK